MTPVARVLLSAAVFIEVASPAAAERCASHGCQVRTVSLHRVAAWRKAGSWCSPPRGFGFYRAQKFQHDCAAPLVIIDEPGDSVWVQGTRR